MATVSKEIYASSNDEELRYGKILVYPAVLCVLVLTERREPNRSFPSSPRPHENLPVSLSTELVRERNDQAGLAGLAGLDSEIESAGY